jgi:hypothetical protein
MSPDKQPKTGNQKQKITLIATVLVVLVVIWQAVKLFGNGDSSAPSPAPTQNVARNTNGQQPSSPPAGAQQATEQPQLTALKQVPVPANNEILKIQQETQAKYIAALNELEMLKVQKEIAETKEAITAATLSTATTEKSITDLLTVQQMPTSGGANAYSPFSATNGSEPAAANANNTPPPLPAPKVQAIQPETYTLLSVSFKAERWKAVLSAQNKLFDVSVGDVLPDKSLVISIDRNGVTLMKDKTRELLTMSSSM